MEWILFLAKALPLIIIFLLIVGFAIQIAYPRRVSGFRMADDEPLRLTLPEKYRRAEGE